MIKISKIFSHSTMKQKIEELYLSSLSIRLCIFIGLTAATLNLVLEMYIHVTPKSIIDFISLTSTAG